MSYQESTTTTVVTRSGWEAIGALVPIAAGIMSFFAIPPSFWWVSALLGAAGLAAAAAIVLAVLCAWRVTWHPLAHTVSIERGWGPIRFRTRILSRDQVIDVRVGHWPAHDDYSDEWVLFLNTEDHVFRLASSGNEAPLHALAARLSSALQLPLSTGYPVTAKDAAQLVREFQSEEAFRESRDRPHDLRDL